MVCIIIKNWDILKINIYTEVQNDFLYNYRKLGYLEKEHKY